MSYILEIQTFFGVIRFFAAPDSRIFTDQCCKHSAANQGYNEYVCNNINTNYCL